MAKAETFSSYKHHNTVKFLIGVTPQVLLVLYQKHGVAGLLINTWAKIVELWSIYYLLMLYWLIGVLLLRTVPVGIPAFTKGNTQLSAFDVERSRKVASVRVHVERVIGLLRKKYTILQRILPLAYLMKKDGINMTTIDNIAVICSALTNMCDSGMPVE